LVITLLRQLQQVSSRVRGSPALRQMARRQVPGSRFFEEGLCLSAVLCCYGAARMEAAACRWFQGRWNLTFDRMKFLSFLLQRMKEILFKIFEIFNRISNIFKSLLIFLM
jgi:hypothetical protein